MSIRHTALFVGAAAPSLNTYSTQLTGRSASVSSFQSEVIGKSAYLSSISTIAPGKAAILISLSGELTGNHIITRGFATLLDGASSRSGRFIANLSGLYGLIYSKYSAPITGVFSVTNTSAIEVLGAGKILNLQDLFNTGKHAVNPSLISSIVLGGNFSQSLDVYSISLSGRHSYMATFVAELFGRHRIANDTLNVYELYRGVGVEPDFTLTPFESFTTLPHVTAALSVSQTYYFTLRKRNAYNLVSQNIASWKVVTDSVGNQSFIAPSTPGGIRIEKAASGGARVKCEYFYDVDGLNQATEFLVYVTGTGVDPDPLTESPVVITMSKTDGYSKLDYLTPTFADGATIKGLVRTRRIEAGPVNVDSLSTSIVSVIADTSGPTAPKGNIFFGKVVSQR